MPTTRRLIYALLAMTLLTLAMASPAPARAQDGVQHVVSPGETLFRIALRYGVSVDALTAANGLANPSQIFAGQVLVIPSASPAPAVADAAAAPAQPAAPAVDSSASSALGADGYYTVQRGETLNRIALRFGVTLQALMSANGIYNANIIWAGQKLAIPGQSPAQAVQAVPASQPAAQTAASGAERTHVVQRGEGLSTIARLYGLQWPTVAAANGIQNPNLIYAGMVLKIPNEDIQTGVANPGAHTSPNSAGKSVLVILSEQMVYAYQDGQLLRSSAVSTGVAAHPTVVGDFAVYVKYSSQTMSGPGYYLPGVPYVMYFYRDYGLHGTYWHSNFGTPMSHGCVNLPTPEAEWLFNWAEIGTPVYVRW
ncbi:MAG: LysM peptidoglycan-binding domain-containing protein [Anaerolineae bacterium]|nr:LysM peptidoglycan-binding domain-containing protein [Anaerolineae bacterium]